MKGTSLPWPKNDDGQLFKGGFNLDVTAGVSHWNKDIYSFANGYRQAADALAHRIISGKSSYSFKASYLVFPIVFLYRQYLELRLKEIIWLGNHLYSQQKGFPQHHRIADLWKDARPFLEKLSPGSQADLDTAGRYMKQLWTIDPDSYAFRYPQDKKGKHLIEEDSLVIDLLHLKKVMSPIGDLLDSSVEGLYVFLEQAGDAAGE